MRGTAVFALLLGGALVLGIGCKKDEAPASGSAPAPSFDPNSTGVAECDDYIKQMSACDPAMAAAAPALREKLRADATANKETTKTQCLEHIKLLAMNPKCAKK